MITSKSYKAKSDASFDQLTNNIVLLAKKIAIVADKNNKKYFFGEGLAIDFSVGKITRNHHDIDFHPTLKDYDWWKEWFKSQGYSIEEPANEDFPETCHVVDNNSENIVDLWPFVFEKNMCVINYKGKYVNANRYPSENIKITYEGMNIEIENPQRVLDQKLKHIKDGGELRPQDIHDFKILGREL